jgi:AraC family transcriptional regulator
MGNPVRIAGSPDQGPEESAQKLEESFHRILEHRSRILSVQSEPLKGFSIAQRRANPSPERFPAQVSPRKHGINVTSCACDVEIEIDSRRKRSIFAPGDFSVVPCGAPTNGSVFRTTEFAHILIEDECLQGVADESDGPGRVELLPILQGRDELLRHLAHTLVAELNRGPHTDTLYTDILSRAIVAHTVKNLSISRPAEDKAHALSTNAVGTVVEYIEGNLDGAVRLEDLAAVVGVSASKLHRQFKLAMGVPLHQYVVRRRIKRARELLSGSKLSFAEIAYRTGFADQSHLTRVLRQHTGLTPKAFRPF